MTRIAKLEELIQEQRNRKANLQARLNEIPVPRMPRGVQAMQHERKQLEGEVTACDEAIRVLTVERDGLHRDLNPDAMDDGTD
jgi:predicted  nucleic acid-binding Zn-ribbon protein